MVEAMVFLVVVMVVFVIYDSIRGKNDLKKNEQFQAESIKLAQNVQESTNAELDAARKRTDAYNTRVFGLLEENNELLKKILNALDNKKTDA
jgi:ATP-dependent Zn protease